MGGLFKDKPTTDPRQAAAAQQSIQIAQQELAEQRRFRSQFIEPLLKLLTPLGLKPGEMSEIAKALYSTDIEGITQAFQGQRQGLIDLLGSQGFRTGSQASGMTGLAQGEAQSQALARRNAIMQNIALALQGGNLAAGQVASFNPQQFMGIGTSAFGPMRQGPGFDLVKALMSSAGQALQGSTAMCWVADALYGENSWEAWTLRLWINGAYKKTAVGFIVTTIYRLIGRRLAWLVKRSPAVKRWLRPVFDHALAKALVPRLSMSDRL